ncbi:hypothetical protein JK182_01925 [Acetobacter okinawensis]|uniref:hypothetical protein n=1 Tax=Acetobacter okinawensis TaxID=1076594 RepID=UPI001BAC8C9A|nr:hypothetical protein [Acetobacter okinawensis]MBS0987452.1 hypothetical protein [Acetobacter okinawensis]
MDITVIFHRIEQANNFISALKAEFISAIIAWCVFFVILLVIFTTLKKQYTKTYIAMLSIFMALLFWVAAAIWIVNFGHPTEENYNSQQKITFSQ